MADRSLLLPQFSPPRTTSVPSLRVRTDTRTRTDRQTDRQQARGGGGCRTPPTQNQTQTQGKGREGRARSAPRDGTPRTPDPPPCTPCPLTGGRAVEDAEVVGPGAAVVGGGAVVPHHHHLLGALEAAHGAHMALAAILLPPLPVRAADHPGPDSFHHHPVVPRAAHPGGGAPGRAEGARSPQAAEGDPDGGGYLGRRAGISVRLFFSLAPSLPPFFPRSLRAHSGPQRRPPPAPSAGRAPPLHPGPAAATAAAPGRPARPPPPRRAAHARGRGRRVARAPPAEPRRALPRWPCPARPGERPGAGERNGIVHP